MGAGVVRRGSRRADDLDGGLVGAPLRFRRVSPSEADGICGSLAAVHLDALRSGMALGALDTMGRGALERWYREVVASLDAAARILLVGEQEGEMVAMGQLALSGATNADHRAEVQRSGWLAACGPGASGGGSWRRSNKPRSRAGSPCCG